MSQRSRTLTRVLTLIRIVQSCKYGLTYQQLAWELDCSIRTIMRDVAAVKEAGLSVVADTQDETGCVVVQRIAWPEKAKAIA